MSGSADHLRYAGLPEDRQVEVLTGFIETQPHLMAILVGMRELGLPDGLLTSGAIYNSVWNWLTARPPLAGIKDADVVYFDGSDLSYEAEDAIIRQADAVFRHCPIRVEVRNQARVHLWAPRKFGIAYPQLQQSADALRNFATRTHAVAARLGDGDNIEIVAPFGLNDMFSFRLVPNPVLANEKTHTAKAERAKMMWPELTVVPWPGLRASG
ncbi:MAG: nucleotidyltransferase family protein [Devosia sp.]|uniref:nucleotidyltransferase family protein n=1 Tax=Devosia sp. TaxID=1871048 RepID=UPI0024CA34DF|nr:nucleotidyltransferase family protein [Devosia sp.]UYN98396.1 MAG: nucleotidyltransferase family protein [Devosia sp.]